MKISFLRFLKVVYVLTYKIQMPDTKLRPKQRFDHVNATNRNSYLNIIYITLVTRVKKLFKNLKFVLLT